MNIQPGIKLDYKDVLIQPKPSALASRKQVALDCTYTFKHSRKEWTGIPIMAANMDGVGTFQMAKALSEYNMFTCITKQNSPKDWYNQYQSDQNYIAVSTGTDLLQLKRAKEIIATNSLEWLCIDIANGYSSHFIDFVKKARSLFPETNIIAGNVVTPEMTEQIISAGADIVKIGIGPGSVCTTRIQTGVGYPQLSAVIECAEVANSLNAHIVADGGCTCPGDIAKAFAAGASFVMLGGMLAGHKEGGGQLSKLDGKQVMAFYGMSSSTAMKKHSGGMADYRSSEGRTVFIPYKGHVSNTVKDILGGLRSTCTYVGASALSQLSKKTTFIRCTQQFNSIFTG